MSLEQHLSRLRTSRDVTLLDQIYKSRNDIDMLKQRANDHHRAITKILERVDELEKQRKNSSESNLSVNRLFMEDKPHKKCCIIL